MAVPSKSYMKLTGGTSSGNSTIHTSSLISIGDNIRISGTARNNGVFTITDITEDGSDVYYILKGTPIVSENSGGDPEIEVISRLGDKMCALGDVDSAGGIDIWSRNATTDYTTKDNGWTARAISPTISGNNAKYIFHFADESLRVCDTNEQNSSLVKWFGYIERQQFSSANSESASVGLVFSEWQEHPNSLDPPKSTNSLTYAYGHTSHDGTDNATAFYQNNRGVAITKQSIVSSSNTNLMLNGAHDFVTTAFTFQNSDSTSDILDQSTTGEVISISNSFTDATCDTTSGDATINHDANAHIVAGLSVSGTGIPVGATILSITNTTTFELSANATASNDNTTLTFRDNIGNTPKEFLFCIKTSGASGGSITYSRSYGGALSGDAPDSHSDEDTPIIERGLGFNIGVDKGTAEGQWESGDYEFYQSFIYDGNQESIPIRMGNGASTIVPFTHTVNDLESIQLSIYADLAYNGRVTGGRIYTRLHDTSDELILLADIDIEKGVRTTLDGDHIGWTYEAGDGFYVIGEVTGNCLKPNIDTYETINGFSPDVSFVSIGGIGELYKASIVTNRRAFVANVRTKGKSGKVEKFADRIMYSEIGKFDTFLEHNFIDVSKGDYGEYTALESFADRLLAFKNNLVHIINISSPSIYNWYLEDTFKYYGVNFPYSVTRTNNGIAWVAANGVYLYDGSSVKNLLDRKIAVSKESFGSTFSNWQLWYSAGVKDPMIGYDSVSNSLLILKSPSDSAGTANAGFLYDFDTDAWVFHNKIFTDSEHMTNFITDWNNNLTVGINVTGDTSDVNFKKFLPIESDKEDQVFVTGDIDFGQPGLIKKIYKVIVTYRASSSETTPFKYAVDGKQNFGGDGGGTFTGNFADTSDKWDVVTLTPSSTISCQSIQIKFVPPSTGTFEINDMTIQYRVIRGKEVT